MEKQWKAPARVYLELGEPCFSCLNALITNNSEYLAGVSEFASPSESFMSSELKI